MSEMQEQTQAPTVNQPKANLLAQYFRQPKIYIKLPSQGKFYPEGSIDISVTGEYPIYAMTAKDELILKTPDALLNGQSTVELIKSCVPAIKDPWKMPSIDVDAVLMAVRVASYGKDMEVSANCPACAHENEYVFDIVEYLNKIQSFEYKSTLEVGDLKINIKPYTYLETTRTAIQALEQQRIISTVTDETLSDEEKLEKFGKSFLKLTELTVDVVCGCIDSITTPEGTVSDKTMIMDFINNTTSEIFNKINDHITALKDSIELRSHNVSCQACQHQYDVAITMDQSNFFAVRS